MNEATYLALKLQLMAHGALRPEAWERILEFCKHTRLKPNETFIRKEGTLAYVAEGILKEYDVKNRKSPVIVNFILPTQWLITRLHNQSYYLKASIPTLVVYWDLADLFILAEEYQELKATYSKLCATYDEAWAYSRVILEEKSARQKIALLLQRYRKNIPQLSKKDLSNYLRLNYDYFTLLFHQLL